MPSSVKLGTKLEDYVGKLVETGRYGSRSEVLREGVRLVHERESRLAMIEAKAFEGRSQIAAGEGIELDDAFDRLARRYADR